MRCYDMLAAYMALPAEKKSLIDMHIISMSREDDHEDCQGVDGVADMGHYDDCRR